MTMLGTLRDLVAHKNHANAALLKLLDEHQELAAAPDILELLHHILVANRFWICTVRGVPFVPDQEMGTERVYRSVAEAYTRTRGEEEAWLDGATESDCAETLVHPFIPGGRCSVAQALLQVCMHSHGHRAQIATLVRRHGVAPPRSDFILWLAGRTAGEP